MTEKLIRDFLMLWATIDPISTALVFSALTRGLEPPARNRIALRATLISGFLLIGSLVLGQVILTAMGISLIAFQIAGGLVLFIFALKLIFEDAAGSAGQSPSGEDLAVFPLAIPSIATPGALLAVIVLTDNHIYSIPTQLGTALITVAILGITYIMMRKADKILALIKVQGAGLLVRVMGLILAALSVQLVIDAFALQSPF